MIGAETFWSLLRDQAHWEFELFLMLIFDVVIGVLIWPRLKARLHREIDEEHGVKHPDGKDWM